MGHPRFSEAQYFVNRELNFRIEVALGGCATQVVVVNW